VVNPAARTDKSSPLYGMPIIDVDRAEHVIVIKRSLAPGFAGVDNALFYMPKTRMLFADGKDALTRILQELRNV
jgi:NAD(P) transhydrogenase subunit beta